MSPFAPALKKMQRSGRRVSAPLSFQSYLRHERLRGSDTARHISVQSFKDLAPELRAANTMVFRLGSPSGQRGTRFALAKCVKDWGDYFFIDESIFKGLSLRPFVPPRKKNHQLAAFKLLPRSTETSFVNFALASGLLARALRLDGYDLSSAPATAQGTYTFEVKPHAKLKVVWPHENGQVEMDAVFLARRQGRETIFVVEAKASPSLDSLAKHKLAYPMLALESKAMGRPIVGVYLRCVRRSNDLEFFIAECGFKGDTKAIGSLSARALGRYAVCGFGPRSDPDERLPHRAE